MSDMYKKDTCEHKNCRYEAVEYKIVFNKYGRKEWFGICPKCKRQTNLEYWGGLNE